MHLTINQQFIIKSDRYLKIVAWAKARYTVNDDLITMKGVRVTRYSLIENLAAVKIMGDADHYPDLSLWSNFFYVAMLNAGRSVLLAGPYAEESVAKAAKRKARDLACEKDDFNRYNMFLLACSRISQRTAFGTI